MPQINKGFSKSKMNKDLDERLVPTGEYRDALNVQVMASDGSDSGTAQTLLGNVLMSAGLVPEGSTCVGSIAHNKEDKIYYFVAGPRFKEEMSYRPGVWKDYILEYDIKTDIFKYVFVDIYRVHIRTGDTVVSRTIPITYDPIYHAKGNIRRGMVVDGYESGTNNHIIVTNNQNVVEITHATQDDSITIYSNSVDFDITTTPSQTLLQCTSRRLLNFDASRYITGINIVDGMLFWTDNFSEPKKISIKRSIAGTGGIAELPTGGGGIGIFDGDNPNFHTRLCITPDASNNLRVKRRPKDTAWFTTEENITVIKKGPRTPPRLVMSQHEDGRDADTFSATDGTAVGISGPPSTSENSLMIETAGTNPARVKKVGESIKNIFLLNAVDWRIGDMILLNQQQDINSAEGFVNHDVRATVTSGTIGAGPWELLIQSIDQSAIDEEQKIWNFRLEEKKPMFEMKFVRFAYRYKYEDGEYSTFSPFSEPAFLPGEYDYLPKKGFNLGMTNRLRQLKITNYIVEDSERPQDVIQVDLLYKDESSPNIYTVESIKLTDGWNVKGELLWPDALNNYNSTILTADRARGQYEVTSELIHAVVPSSQLLRPWDNVPRKALAQEVTSNRLVYGNYVQNFDLTGPYTNLEIKPRINVALYAVDAPLNAPDGTSNAPLNGEDNIEGFASPGKTVRSLRTYQLGVVYGDEYGRETPVLAGEGGTGSLTIDIANSSTLNKLRVDIHTEAPSFAYYYKYFIKETSNEYYNLAMDRWYDAEDGNIWLSFASADRNKLDEDTFIILKKKHDTHEPVVDPARYKIIAIENEAPDFIKTNIKQLASAKNNGAKSHIGTTGNGFPLEDYDQMWVNKDATNAKYFFSEGEQELIDKISAGTLYMRVRTTTIKSEWYQVINFKIEGTGSNGFYKFKSDKPFKEDVNFTSTSGDYNSRIGGLQVELADFKVENKKEFEGRFFVKIYKDLVLLQNLLQTAEPKYRVLQAAPIGYWNMPKNKYRKLANSNVLSWEHCALINQGDLAAPSSPNASSGGGIDPSPEDTLGSGSNVNIQLAFRTGVNGYKDGVSATGCAAFEGTKLWCQNSTGRFHIDSMWNRGTKQGNGAECNRNDFTGGGGLGQSRGRGISNGGKSMDIGYICSGDFNFGPGDFDFIAQLKAAGTTFRFREDEDSIIYIVTNSEGASSDNSTNFGKYHNYHSVSAGNPGNNRFRWRIDFERADQPGVGLGTGAAGYHPTGPRSSTKNPDVAELGFYGGRQGSRGWNVGDNAGESGPLVTKWAIPSPPGVAADTVFSGTNGYSNSITGESFDGIEQAKRYRSHPGRFHHIELVEPIEDEDYDWSSKNPAVWETEPKEDVGMDIYYEASPALPVRVDYKTNEMFAPYGSLVLGDYGTPFPAATTIESWNGDEVELSNNVLIPGSGFRIAFQRPDGFRTHAIIKPPPGTMFPWTTDTFRIRAVPVPPAAINAYSDAPHNQPTTLSWYNAYAFGNGIESDRIRDDYNEKTLTNGVKASTVLAKQYKEERRKTGLIHSGIYNSTSGVNNLNQFLTAEKITKDMNPKYGSIQKLHTRDSNIVVMHEDKIMKVLADKDALFNADGGKNVAISSNFLGSDEPFATKYGISTNPESFATDLAGRVYFSDRSRGAILRLSNDGITNISDYGMKDWFNDHLNPYTDKILGSFDQKKALYNISIDGYTENVIQDEEDVVIEQIVNDICDCSTDTIDGYGEGFQNTNIIPFSKTLSFSESSKGWVSFKSFLPESGLSINNNYYTFKGGDIYRHHANNRRNFFYGIDYDSSLNILFNDDPAAVKSFSTLNYEGSQSRVTRDFDTVLGGDKQYHNLLAKDGWYIDSIKTDLQECDDIEFKSKEGKYFAYIKGNTTTLGNLDESEFSVQGIGRAHKVIAGPAIEEPGSKMCLTIKPVMGCNEVYGCMNNISPNYNPLATIDDNSCQILGCIDEDSTNYNEDATVDDGSCEYEGCTDNFTINSDGSIGALNYNPNATVDDGTCIYPDPPAFDLGTTSFGVNTPNNLDNNNPNNTDTNGLNGIALAYNVCAWPFEVNEPYWGAHTTQYEPGNILYSGSYSPQTTYYANGSTTPGSRWQGGQLQGTSSDFIDISNPTFNPDQYNNGVYPHNNSGRVYVESYYYDLINLDTTQSYTLSWQEIVLALKPNFDNTKACDDCLAGAWAVKYELGASGGVSVNDISNSPFLYNPVPLSDFTQAANDFINYECNTDNTPPSPGNYGENTAGAPNGSYSNWNAKSISFTPVMSPIRIHIFPMTNFMNCTTCQQSNWYNNANPNAHGVYMGISKLDFVQD